MTHFYLSGQSEMRPRDDRAAAVHGPRGVGGIRVKPLTGPERRPCRRNWSP